MPFSWPRKCKILNSFTSLLFVQFSFHDTRFWLQKLNFASFTFLLLPFGFLFSIDTMVSSSFHLETSYGNDMDWTNEAVLNSFSVTDEPLLMLKKSNLRESTLGWHYLNHFDIKSLLIEMACELSHHIRHTPWLKKQHVSPTMFPDGFSESLMNA